MNEQLTQLREKKLRSESGVYTWTFPGAPIRIEIGLDVIARLEAAVTGTCKNGGAIEIGGVLLGTIRSPSTVEVNDYALVEGDPDSKRGYVADAYELERLCSGNDRSMPDLHVVGYFRTQREHALELRNEEMKTIRRHFSDSRQVVLLIRSSAEQCTAGFLFWDGGVLSPFSFLEFPFAAGVLRSEVKLELGAPCPEERPIADEAPQVTSVVSETRSRLPRITLLALSIGLMLLAAVFVFKARGRSSPAPQPNQPAPLKIVVATAPLQLEVEARGNGLDVRWNPESKTIARARDGKLTILDGQSPRMIALNAQQLTGGHVYYQPSTDRIEFQLVVVDDAGQASEESVMALLSKTEDRASTSPHIDPTTAAAGAKRNLETPHPIRQPPRVFTIPLQRQKEEPAAPALIQDAPPLPAIEVAASSNLMPVITPRITVPPVAPTIPAERPPKNASDLNVPAVQESKPPNRPAERFELAVAKKKPIPVLPPSTASQFPQKGSIEVVLRIHIDEAGRVTGAEPISKGTKSALDIQLEKAAIDAAMWWRFEPARSNEKPVASNQNISFVFQRNPPGPSR